MEQLTDMGFNRELASQALAATGGKSTLKATEWILNQRKEQQSTVGTRQHRVDDFFITNGTVDATEEVPKSAPPFRGETSAKRQKHENDDKALKSVSPSPTKCLKNMVPLAERMRPGTIDEIVGQDHLVGSNGIIRSLLETDTLASVILWGPPGTGKTSLARAIASTVSYRFVALSAVTTGVKEVRGVLEEAKKAKKQTLMFLDEVHRFNKAQQDALLPSIEAGHIVFIGATTENPSFEINAALLSRCKVLTVKKLQTEHIRHLLEISVFDKERGVVISAKRDFVKVEDDAIQFLAGAADGDARVALNTLEISVLAAVSRSQKCATATAEADGDSQKDAANSSTAPTERYKSSFNILDVLKENVQHSQQEYTRPFKKFVGGRNVTPQIAAAPFETEVRDHSNSTEEDFTKKGFAAAAVVVVTLADVREALQRSHVLYDKNGEEHYNVISALHKSMRGGDADAAIYWLARMLEGGEGPLYIARRLIRFASEDIGLADPQALVQATACYQCCHFLGMPECNVHLAQCVVYMALAPKSVAIYQAIEGAQKMVRDKGHQNEGVPLHLRNAPTGLMKELGYGKGYIYPPSHTGLLDQHYLPPSLWGHKFLHWPSA